MNTKKIFFIAIFFIVAILSAEGLFYFNKNLFIKQKPLVGNELDYKNKIVREAVLKKARAKEKLTPAEQIVLHEIVIDKESEVLGKINNDANKVKTKGYTPEELEILANPYKTAEKALGL
jgi:hypothetical protein